MADPFSIGAGVVGVISLIIQITQITIKCAKEWKGAPVAVKEFMAELAVLKTILSEMNTNVLLNPDFADVFQQQPSLLLSQLGAQAPKTTDTKVMLQICGEKLRLLLEDLKQSSEGHRLGWDRLKVAFSAKDVRVSIQDLSGQCQLLNRMLTIDGTLLAMATHKEVREGRKEWQEWRQADAKITILDWISSTTYATQQNDLLDRRQKGTGEWLLQSAEFHEWITTNQHTLFCPGIPGAGKTMLTAIVIEHLTTLFANNSGVGIAYIYCHFQRQNEQTIGAVLSSLLRQLTEILLSFPEAVESLFQKHNPKHTYPTVDEVSPVLKSVISSYSTVFIVVDALDECSVLGSRRLRLISEILSLQVGTGVKY